MTLATKLIASANGELRRLPEDPVAIPVQDFAWADQEFGPMYGLVAALAGFVGCFTILCGVAFVVVAICRWMGWR